MSEENNNNTNNPKWTEETKSGFIEGIVRAFDGFVGTFKKNGLATVSFILVLFMILYSFVLHPIDINSIVTKALQQSKLEEMEQKQRSIQQRLQSDKIMLNMMDELTSNYGVDRAMLFELHNSTQNISGIEFLYMSCSYEVLNPNDYDIEYVADSFQKQYLTQFVGNESYNKLKHTDYLYFSNLEDYHRSNYRLIAKLRHFGANSVMLIPFVDGKNMPLLILVLVSDSKEMDAQKIYNYVKSFRTSIEANLMNI